MKCIFDGIANICAAIVAIVALVFIILPLAAFLQIKDWLTERA